MRKLMKDQLQQSLVEHENMKIKNLSTKAEKNT
jgi:hypothetical protein